ncbi:hypothetical protein ACWD6R_31160 [Streptomyces sp. NPDC005151]
MTASATPDQVWDRISDFYALHTWQPLITAAITDPEHADTRVLPRVSAAPRSSSSSSRPAAPAATGS